jgi:hypothetical protein
MTMKVPVKINLEPDEAMKQLLDRVSPQYPAEARAAHLQGTVSLLVTIGKDGSVTDVKENQRAARVDSCRSRGRQAVALSSDRLPRRTA